MVYKEPHIAGGSKGILYPYEKYNKKECFLEKYVLLQPQNLYSLSGYIEDKCKPYYEMSW